MNELSANSPTEHNDLQPPLRSDSPLAEQGFVPMWKRIFRTVRRILRRADDHHIYLAASGIAFNILLFLLPTMLVIVFVIGTFMEQASVIALMEDFLLEVLPPDGGLDAAIDIIKIELHSVLKNYQGAGWIGVPILFWVSLTLFSSLRTGLNAVFSFSQKRHFLGSAVLKDSFLLGLFVGAVFMSNVTPRIAASVTEWTTTSVSSSQILKNAVSFSVTGLIVYMFFVALYSFAPNRLPPLLVVFASAFFCLVFWEIARYGFGWYVKYFASYGKVYGIYGAAVAVAFWVYYSALVILFSGELAQYWYEARRRTKLEKKNIAVVRR
ncbi:MAG: YihY/virulence factor BrkB family protein [Candidatus Kapaibacterium sp.]|nr:MAG: YihY/virulence factor BrkB family protein [Candidatus Kapabacteria bacterium]